MKSALLGSPGKLVIPGFGVSMCLLCTGGLAYKVCSRSLETEPVFNMLNIEGRRLMCHQKIEIKPKKLPMMFDLAFSILGLVFFDSISTPVGYLVPKPCRRTAVIILNS